MADLEAVRVLGFAGSLRKGSYNRMALRAAQELLPQGMTLETFDITPIPLYNEDVRAQGFPAPVQEFRDRIAAAGALLIVTSEYNYSVPGVLQHAGNCAGAVSSAPELRLSQYACAQPAGGDDRPLSRALRRARTLDR